MSDLTFNKIAGAVLATGLALVGLRELSAGVFEPEQPAKPGYAVEVAEETGEGAPAADTPPDWGTVLPAADVKAGEAIFAKCKSCHNADNGGPNATGPNLWGVEGRKPASHAGFAYSPAMTDFGSKNPQWDYDRLYVFLKAPQKDVPGTKMTFVGLKKPEERINVIAYLHSQGGTLPIPAPDPSRAPGAQTVAAAAGAPAAAGATPPAKSADQPTAVAAAPPSTAGGPAGQGEKAPAPGAPAQQKGSSAAQPTASGPAAKPLN